MKIGERKEKGNFHFIILYVLSEKEQRIAEEVAARAAAIKDMTNGRRQIEPETRQHYLNSLQPYNDVKNVNYNDYDQAQYVSNIANLGQSLSVS